MRAAVCNIERQILLRSISARRLGDRRRPGRPGPAGELGARSGAQTARRGGRLASWNAVVKGRGANGLRPAAAPAARMFGGVPTATAFRVQPSRPALPSRDGAGEQRTAPPLTVNGC